MLSFTVAQKPLEKIMERISKRYETKVKVALCHKINDKKDEYEEFSKTMFISGCIWHLREDLLSFAKNQKERDIVYKGFVKDGSSAFDDAVNMCSKGAVASIEEFRIANHIVSDLWLAVGCDKIQPAEFYKEDGSAVGE
jgi:hypothetical protein